MGSKFAYIYIRELSEVHDFIPGSVVKRLSDEWTCITSDNFNFEIIDQIGRKLSRKIDKLVVSIGYFDDDILTLNLFRDGKSITSHISDDEYGFKKKLGDPAIFAEEFELGDECKEYFKWIFKCENLSKKIELLEKLLGVPIWLDNETLDRLDDIHFRYKRDFDFIKQYIQEKKVSNKIKNITKASVIMEMEGFLAFSSTKHYVLINTPNENGEYYLDMCKLYKILPDGTLKYSLNDNTIRFTHSARMVSDEKTVILDESCYHVDTNKEEKSMRVYTNEGEPYLHSLCLEKVGTPILFLPDRSAIFKRLVSKDVGNELHRFDMNGLKQWEIIVDYLHVLPILYQDYIYFQYETAGFSEIIKINQLGEIVARFELSPWGSSHWMEFLFDNNSNLYFCCSLDIDDSCITKLFCFTNDLQLKSVLELSDTSYKGLLDSEQRLLYVSIFEKDLLTINIDTMQICASKKNDEDLDLLCIDKYGNIVTRKGSSTIEIYDSNWNIKSRHRLKGNIYKVYHNAVGNVCILSDNYSSYCERRAEESMIWVNEIAY